MESLTPPAAGDPEGRLSRLWVGGFGSWAKQKDGDGVHGYEYDNKGVALGYDHEFDSILGLVAGVSTAFSFGTTDLNDGRTTVDVNTAGFGLYASYTTDSGSFADASFNYSVGKHESKVNLITGGNKKAEFDVKVIQVGARVGTTHITESNWTLIPTVGVRYARYIQEEYEESVSGSPVPGNSYGRISDVYVEFPLELRIQNQIQAGDLIATPELRVGWTYIAKEPDNKVSVGFAGHPLRTDLYGTKSENNYFTAGLGLKVDTLGALDFFANYDINASKNYTGHHLSAGLGYQF